MRSLPFSSFPLVFRLWFADHGHGRSPQRGTLGVEVAGHDGAVVGLEWLRRLPEADLHRVRTPGVERAPARRVDRTGQLTLEGVAPPASLAGRVRYGDRRQQGLGVGVPRSGV